MTDIKELISNIQLQISKIGKGVIKAQEAEDFFADSIRKAKEIFGKDSDEWRMIDRWENENGYIWHKVYGPGRYSGEKQKDKLIELKKKLELITNTEPTPDNQKKEYSFSAVQKYEAYKVLVSILKGAKETITIVDNFLDEVVFDFIDVIDDNVIINLITDTKRPIFKRLYIALKTKPGINVKAKYNNASHDRYIVIDGNIVFSMGASINTIGKSDFMIHLLEDTKDEVRQKILNWWDNGLEIL